MSREHDEKYIEELRRAMTRMVNDAYVDLRHSAILLATFVEADVSQAKEQAQLLLRKITLQDDAIMGNYRDISDAGLEEHVLFPGHIPLPLHTAHKEEEGVSIH